MTDKAKLILYGVVIVGLAFAFLAVDRGGYNRAKRDMLNAPADTTTKETIRRLQIRADSLEVRLAEVNASLSDSVDAIRATVESKSRAATFYRRLADSLERAQRFRTPVASFSKAVHNYGRYAGYIAEYIDSVSGEYWFPPVNQFRNIRVKLQDRIIDTTVIEHTMTISKYLPEPVPFLDIGLDLSDKGYWDEPFFKSNIFEVSPWLSINATPHVKIELVPMGVEVRGEARLMHKAGLRLTL